jgi:serine/threonine-protein kinase
MSIDSDWLKQQFPDLDDLQPLSSGGQKIVFSCVDCQCGPCVLKLIRPGSEIRFERELEAVRRIISDHIPVIYRVGLVSSQLGDLIWLIEQRIDGITLRELLHQGPLQKELIRSIASSLISASASAEAVHVVHRDIKPENIIIDQYGKAWLLDFGIARILDMDSETRTDAPSGPHTPGYGAPEQFRNRKREIDGRTDLFAIGVVLNECVTGVNPFTNGARDRIEILNRVEKMPLPKLNMPWDLDGRFSEFIQSLTQKFPYQRPSSCSEALKWIKEIIDLVGG